MQGSLGQWLAFAAAVALAAMVALGLMLNLGLSQADRLLDRSAISQMQLALANRLEADATGLMVDVPAVRLAAATALTSDLATYRASITRETSELDPSGRATQEEEAVRAADLAQLAARMSGETGPVLVADAARFRTIVEAIAERETGEHAQMLGDMRALRRCATLFSALVPLVVATLTAWFLWAMRAGLTAPLAKLRKAAGRIGEHDTFPAISGFTDFAPLTISLASANREILRQRRALEGVNRSLEEQVSERTAALAQQNARLAALDATRRLFFSQVGHELRTPVTVIRGEAEVVLRDSALAPERLREALEHVVANGAFLGRRIDDLLAIARAEDGQLKIERAPVELARIVRSVAEIAAPYAASAGATITLDLDAGPIPLTGDANWLQQALLALVDNSVKHAAGEGGRMLLSVAITENDAVVTVADDGGGVTAESLPHLFDAWYRSVDSSGGAGLGLAVARWVAEAHGGSITAENGDSGLVVALRMPRA